MKYADEHGETPEGDKEEAEEKGEGGAESEEAAEGGDCSGGTVEEAPPSPPSGVGHIDGGTRSSRRGRYAGAAPCGASCDGTFPPALAPAAGAKIVDASSRQLAKPPVPACCCCCWTGLAAVAAAAFRLGEKIDAKNPPAAAKGDFSAAGRVAVATADGSEAAARPNPPLNPPPPPPPPSRLLPSLSRFGGGGGVLDDLEDVPDDDAAAGLPLCPLRPAGAFGTVPVANATPPPLAEPAPVPAPAAEPAGIGLVGTPPTPTPGIAPKLNVRGREGGTTTGRGDDEPTLNNRPPEGEGMGFTPAGAAAGAAARPKTNDCGTGGIAGPTAAGDAAGPKTNDCGRGGVAGPAAAGDAPGRGIAAYAGGGGGGGGGDNGCC